MKFWVDAQLPPQLAAWLSEQFHVKAFSLRQLGLRDAADAEIFQKAQQQDTVTISKDSDSVEMLSRYWPPAVDLGYLRQCHQPTIANCIQYNFHLVV